MNKQRGYFRKIVGVEHSGALRARVAFATSGSRCLVPLRIFPYSFTVGGGEI